MDDFFALVFIALVGGIVYMFVTVPFIWVPFPIAVLLWFIHRTDWYQERLAQEKTQKLFETARLKGAVTFPTFAAEVLAKLPTLTQDTKLHYDFRKKVVHCLYDLSAYYFENEVDPPPAVCASISGAQYRDYLIEIIDTSHSHNHAVKILSDCIHPVIRSVDLENKALFTCKLSEVSNARNIAESVTYPLFEDSVWFKDVRERLKSNREMCQQKDEDEVEVFDMLYGTPLLDLFEQTVPMKVEEKHWFEGAWIIAPSGTGKTQLLQYLIAKRLDDLDKGASIVVIDAHGDLKKNVLNIGRLGLDGDLSNRLISISPDIKNPPALNLFDMGKDRIGKYEPEDREKFTNIVTAQLTYMLQAIMGDGGALTPKQTVLFEYIVRLLMLVEDATLDTFQSILEVKTKEGLNPYKKQISQLPKPAQDFFDTQFIGKDFNNTRGEVAWRLSAIRKSNYFEKMFSAKKSKLDMFTELNSGKLIFVDTNKEYLGDDGTNIMGRYFIGSILAAARERSSLDKGERKPVYVFIDEAHDYISNDKNIASLLDQARKMNVSLIMAHQRTKQIKDANVLDALKTTKIKFANTNNQACLAHLAPAMDVDKSYLSRQEEMSFAISVGRDAAFTFKVPLLYMEKLPKMSDDEVSVFKTLNRLEYCYSTEVVAEEVGTQQEIDFQEDVEYDENDYDPRE